MKFYTDAMAWGNTIYYKEIVDGKSHVRQTKFSPSLYIPTSTENPMFRSMEQAPLKKITFDSIKEAKDFVKQYKGVGNHKFYGNTSWLHQFLSEQYRGMEYDVNDIAIWTLDIETEVSGEGFTGADEASQRINLLTMLHNGTKKYITWGLKPFDYQNAKSFDIPDFDLDSMDFEYRHCQSESHLLSDFLSWWKHTQIDALTGWNIDEFDVPYLVNRVFQVLGEQSVGQFSPYGIVQPKKARENNGGSIHEYNTFTIGGIAILDYLRLYKKFGTYSKKESYKLDFIGEEELGVRKIELDVAFKDAYADERWDKFVCYNIRDCEIVDKLEDKQSLIGLAYNIAFIAKCLPAEVYGPVKVWDCIIYNFLLGKGVVVPQKQEVESWKIAGAYVKEPVPAKYVWGCSVDAESLYPTIIRQYNMSPETMLGHIPMADVTVEGLIAKEYDLSYLKTHNMAMTANGQYFTNEKRGYFPEITTLLFGDRKRYKKEMKRYETQMELLKPVMEAKGQFKGRIIDFKFDLDSPPDYTKLSDDELVTVHKIISKGITKYNNFQQAMKILLNSLYGATSNEYFRFYDPRYAEGITLTGQYFIKVVGDAINTYLRKVCGNLTKDYVITQDTDSCYYTLDDVVKKFIMPKLEDGYNINKIVDSLIKITDEKITPVINNACNDIADYTNSIDQYMNFKREAVFDAGIFIAKKRYALNVLDNENVRYATPKMKVMGLQIVQSSTPAPVRKMLKAAMEIILKHDEATLHKFYEEQQAEFFKIPVEKLAYPRGVQGLAKYGDETTIYKKGCPKHVRASLLYNKLLNEKGLTGQYDLIGEGDRMKYIALRLPNTLREDVIAFSDKLPPEFGLHQYVDYHKMWESAFDQPLSKITGVIGWEHEPRNTLDCLFG